MTPTKTYVSLNRLRQIASTPSASPGISFAYEYNNANQRTAVTNADGTYWLYGYDALGQVTSGVKYFNNGVPVPGEQFGYAFDNIGNRTSTTAGGDQYGNNLRTATYGANVNNQYTNRTVPGAVDILGSAVTNATVTVNNQPTYRNGTFYEATLALTNTSAAVWQSITNLAVAHSSATTDLVATVTGNAFLQQTPEAFSYDSDGNLTQDGRWSYTWDGENRLIQMVSLTNAPTASKLRLTFGYDSKWRRICKAVEAFNGASWATNLAESFVYDGWNLVDELNATNNAVVRSYMWGLDLSGSLQGAGGVGGILEMNDEANAKGTHFASFDAGGNVICLVSASAGLNSAQYEFDPFGFSILTSGPEGKANPFRYSCKYEDLESELVFYGYREYAPRNGTWLNRDPIGEAGSGNLYLFVKNSPLRFFDKLGTLDCPIETLEVEQSALDRTTGPLTGFHPLADTAVIWSHQIIPKLCPCGNSYQYESTCKARIRYLKPASATKLLRVNTSDNTVQEHEMQHYGYLVRAYSRADDAWKMHAGRCLPMKCYNAMMAYLNALTEQELAFAEFINAEFDAVDYLPGPGKEIMYQEAKSLSSAWTSAESETTRLFGIYKSECGSVNYGFGNGCNSLP